MAQGLTLTTSAHARRYMNMAKMASQFKAAMLVRENEAAKKATQVSRQVFVSKLSPRPLVAARPGRPTTGGQFVNDIEWRVTGMLGSKQVGIDLFRLPRYALIQEIGTGQSATITNPAYGTVRVSSQVGRYISQNLVWSSGGVAVPASVGRRGMDQLVWASQVNTQNVRTRRMRIRHEIKGKHYLRDGGAAGFRTLKQGALRDAKRIFQ